MVRAFCHAMNSARATLFFAKAPLSADAHLVFYGACFLPRNKFRPRNSVLYRSSTVARKCAPGLYGAWFLPRSELRLCNSVLYLSSTVASKCAPGLLWCVLSATQWTPPVQLCSVPKHLCQQMRTWSFMVRAFCHAVNSARTVSSLDIQHTVAVAGGAMVGSLTAVLMCAT